MFFKKNTNQSTIPEIVVTHNSANANESFGRLKDNVIYYSDNGKHKIFQIESSVAGEGKSTVCVNLAVSLAKSQKKVLIIDLDLRRPKIHKVFNVPNFNGLIEYMLDECNKEELIKHTEYGVDIINRGKSAYNASIILTSNKFKDLIEDCKKEYDIILFDCAPILQVSDYIYISQIAESVIFVISGNKVRRSQAKEAITMLKRNNVNILGSVITFSSSIKMGYYSDYVKYYNKYYGNYTEQK